MASLSEISVTRPVTIIMIYLGFILLGCISISRMKRELFPSISFPQLSIVTTYGNAAPEEVENLITKIIEEAVGTVNNLMDISSKSKEGKSTVTIQFSWDTNMDFAALELREKIDLIKSRLPRDSEEPVIIKYNPYDLPVMILSISSLRDSASTLRITKKYIKEGLEKIEGIASCELTGGRERQINIQVDRNAMVSRGLSLKEISDSLGQANLNYPAGVIKEHFFEILIRTVGEFHEISEFDSVPIAIDNPREDKESKQKYFKGNQDNTQDGHRIIYLEDIAVVEDGLKDRHSYSRHNLSDNISISVRKQAQANVVQCSQRIYKEIDTIKEKLPEDFSIRVIYDQATFINQSISGVIQAVWQGGLISFLVLLFFLAHLRSAFVVSLAIPTSVMMTFAFMFFNHVSLNMMSLAGLALGIGMMVDSAIVILENIDHKKKLYKPKKAIIEGTDEMASSVVSSTLTTVAVFLPLVFVIGLAGQIFRDLSFTVNFSLISSMVVSLTLIPRLCLSSSDYKAEQHADSFVARFNHFLTKINAPIGFLNHIYPKFLRFTLKTPYILLPVVILIFILSIFGFIHLIDREVMPKVDQRQFQIKITLPTGTILEKTNDIAVIIEEILHNQPEILHITSRVGSEQEGKQAKFEIESLQSNQSEINVLLKDCPTSSRQVVNRVRSLVHHDSRLLGAQIEFIVQESLFSLSSNISDPIVLQLKGHKLTELKLISEKICESLETIPGVVDIKNFYPKPNPETQIRIDKKKAALYGVSVNEIATAVNIALKGTVATKFKVQGDEIDVLVRLKESQRDSFADLNHVSVFSKKLKRPVPVKGFAYLVRCMGPNEIYRHQQRRTILISASLENRSLSDILPSLQNLVDNTILPLGYTLEIGGEQAQMKESFDSLRFAFILSIILVYMIMAAQFESFGQPFLILMTVPLSLIGVFCILYMTGLAINIVVILGIIMLAGIVVNNGIVLISTANEMRSQGLSILDASLQSSSSRLRPILMTTATTVLGLIPLALGLSKGSEMQQPMAITVMGGLSISTFLTLFVIPCLYYITEHIKLYFSQRLLSKQG